MSLIELLKSKLQCATCSLERAPRKEAKVASCHMYFILFCKPSNKGSQIKTHFQARQVPLPDGTCCQAASTNLGDREQRRDSKGTQEGRSFHKRRKMLVRSRQRKGKEGKALSEERKGRQNGRDARCWWNRTRRMGTRAKGKGWELNTVRTIDGWWGREGETGNKPYFGCRLTSQAFWLWKRWRGKGWERRTEEEAIRINVFHVSVSPLLVLRWNALAPY